MFKKLLITLICLGSFLTPVMADQAVVDIIPVDVTGFVNQDTTSSIDVNPNVNEVGIYSDVVVRILDKNNHPLANHTVVIYVDGSPASTNVIQSSNQTDNDGYAIGKVRSTIQGTYTVKAYDNTYGQSINLLDSDSLTVFPIPTPNILTEPYYTKGTSNRIYWGTPGGLSSYSYYIEASLKSDFSNVFANSGWVNTISYEFNNLTASKLFYYRVKAKNVGGSISEWSSTVFSTQDNKPPLISYVDIQRVDSKNIFSGISVKFDVTDNFEIGSVKFFCKQKNGDLKECGSMEHSGARYYVNVPTGDLERGGFGAYLPSYTFCVEAWDKAGNYSTNCDFKIDVADFVQTPVPLFTNLINSIIKYLNDNINDLGNKITSSLITSQEVLLQFMTLLIYICVVVISLSILAQGFFIVPTFVLYNLLRFFKFIGFKKNGRLLGVVYDAITGRGVKYAKVTIYDSSNKLVHTDVTNRKGEFYGNIDLGKYRVSVSRSHYLYPSELYKEFGVQKYGKLYRGEYLILNKKNPMNLAIPIDPINIYSDWEKDTNFEKKMVGMLKAITFLFISLGLAVAVITFEKYTNLLNLIFLLMYIPAIGIYLKSVIKLKVG